MKNLLDRIIGSIEAVDKEKLPVGLYGGKLGYSILYLLSVFTSDNGLDSVPSNVIKYLNGALNNYKSWPNGLLYGNMGALWGLKYLVDKGIIEAPKSMEKMAYEIIQHNLLNLHVPSDKNNVENGIYPFGITMLRFWDGSESIFRYCWEEKIILHVHECESILIGDFHYSHIQNYLNAAHLHSILYFVLQTKKKRIATFKSGQIITLIEDLRTTIKGLNKSDEYILDFLLNISSQIDITEMPIDELLDFMGHIGMFSLFYDSPQLFMNVFNECKDIDANFIEVLYDKCNTNFVSIKTLIGIGFGLLHLLNNMSDE